MSNNRKIKEKEIVAGFYGNETELYFFNQHGFVFLVEADGDRNDFPCLIMNKELPKDVIRCQISDLETLGLDEHLMNNMANFNNEYDFNIAKF